MGVVLVGCCGGRVDGVGVGVGVGAGVDVGVFVVLLVFAFRGCCRCNG